MQAFQRPAVINSGQIRTVRLMGQELALASVGEDVVKQGNPVLLKKISVAY